MEPTEDREAQLQRHRQELCDETLNAIETLMLIGPTGAGAVSVARLEAARARLAALPDDDDPAWVTIRDSVLALIAQRLRPPARSEQWPWLLDRPRHPAP